MICKLILKSKQKRIGKHEAAVSLEALLRHSFQMTGGTHEKPHSEMKMPIAIRTRHSQIKDQLSDINLFSPVNFYPQRYRRHKCLRVVLNSNNSTRISQMNSLLLFIVHCLDIDLLLKNMLL